MIPESPQPFCLFVGQVPRNVSYPLDRPGVNSVAMICLRFLWRATAESMKRKNNAISSPAGSFQIYLEFYRVARKPLWEPVICFLFFSAQHAFTGLPFFSPLVYFELPIPPVVPHAPTGHPPFHRISTTFPSFGFQTRFLPGTFSPFPMVSQCIVPWTLRDLSFLSSFFFLS